MHKATISQLKNNLSAYLKAADSLQLAAAIIAAEREPVTVELVSLDER